MFFLILGLLGFANGFYCGFDRSNFCPGWVAETPLTQKTFKIFRENRIGSESFRRSGGFVNFQSNGENIFSELETPKFQLRTQKGY